MRRIATVVAVLLGALAAPTVAAAQQYPIDAPPAVRSFGSQRPGDTFNKEDCGFQAGTTAEIRLNDTAAGTKQVEGDGCVRLTVRIVDQDTVSIDGREYDARRCRSNVIFVTAPVAGGAARQRQVENRFTINCGGIAGNNLPRTGTDVADLAALGGVLVVLGATVVTIVRRRRTGDATATA
jgi:LPXTG-motif cell wall-anchored protein